MAYTAESLDARQVWRGPASDVDRVFHARELRQLDAQPGLASVAMVSIICSQKTCHHLCLAAHLMPTAPAAERKDRGHDPGAPPRAVISLSTTQL